MANLGPRGTVEPNWRRIEKLVALRWPLLGDNPLLDWEDSMDCFVKVESKLQDQYIALYQKAEWEYYSMIHPCCSAAGYGYNGPGVRWEAISVDPNFGSKEESRFWEIRDAWEAMMGFQNIPELTEELEDLVEQEWHLERAYQGLIRKVARHTGEGPRVAAPYTIPQEDIAWLTDPPWEGGSDRGIEHPFDESCDPVGWRIRNLLPHLGPNPSEETVAQLKLSVEQQYFRDIQSPWDAPCWGSEMVIRTSPFVTLDLRSGNSLIFSPKNAPVPGGGTTVPPGGNLAPSPVFPTVVSESELTSRPKKMAPLLMDTALEKEQCVLSRGMDDTALRNGTAVFLKAENGPADCGLKEEDASRLKENSAAGPLVDPMYCELVGGNVFPISPPVNPGLVSRSKLPRAWETPVAVDETQVPTSSPCPSPLLLDTALEKEKCVLPRGADVMALRNGTAVFLKAENGPAVCGLKEEDPSRLKENSAAGPLVDPMDCELVGGNVFPTSPPVNPGLVSRSKLPRAWETPVAVDEMQVPTSSPCPSPSLLDTALEKEKCVLSRGMDVMALRNGTAVFLKADNGLGVCGLEEEDPSRLKENNAADPLAVHVNCELVGGSKPTSPYVTPAAVDEKQVPTSSPSLSLIAVALEKEENVFSRCRDKIARKIGQVFPRKKKRSQEIDGLEEEEPSRLPQCSATAPCAIPVDCELVGGSEPTSPYVTPGLVDGSEPTRPCETLAVMSGTTVLISSPKPVAPFPDTPALVSGTTVLTRDALVAPGSFDPSLVGGKSFPTRPTVDPARGRGTTVLPKEVGSCPSFASSPQPVCPGLVSGSALLTGPLDVPTLSKRVPSVSSSPLDVASAQESGSSILSCSRGVLAQPKGADVPSIHQGDPQAIENPETWLPQGGPPYRLAMDPEPLDPDPGGSGPSSAWSLAQERPPNLVIARTKKVPVSLAQDQGPQFYSWPRTKGSLIVSRPQDCRGWLGTRLLGQVFLQTWHCQVMCPLRTAAS